MIGVCVGETSPSQVEFISKEMPQMGEYVVLEYQDVRVLGMVETLIRGSPYITDEILDPDTVLKILNIEGGSSNYIRGTVRLQGDLENLELPRTPPPPGTKIYRAEDEDLKKVFPRDGLRIGKLLSHPEVEVRLDPNKMLTRHLAVLAITGAGKSNTIAVLIDQLLENNACILVFDMHSEYSGSTFKNNMNKISPKLNPSYLSPGEFTRLLNITGKAHIEERHARAAYKTALKTLREEGGNFFETMRWELEQRKEDETYKNDRKSIIGVQNKLEDFLEKYGSIMDVNAKDTIDQLKLANVNIIDLGIIDETISDVLVSHVLRKLLQSRKNHTRNGDGIPYPVFTIIEEAHVFVPQNRSTDSKYWVSRIAREGRKFGVGLCLVSQRPKSLDPEALSQANNMIILRLVEPGDQRHVQQASERLSSELLELLPGLNIGEAVVLGLMTKIPALVKIDRFQGKLAGGDPDVIGIWKQETEEHNRRREKTRRQAEDIYDW